MKIRLGFVSNSSSSSFMCPRDTFPSVFQLGREMLKIRNSDWKVGNSRDKTYLKKLQIESKKMDKAEKLGIDIHTAISFATTNYDTFIRLNLATNYYEIDTCNNQDWSQLPRFDNFRYVDDIHINTLYPFWFIKEGVLGHITTEVEWTRLDDERSISYNWPRCWINNDHFNDIVTTIHDDIICIDCYRISKKPDMLLEPTPKAKPEYVIVRPVKLRG